MRARASDRWHVIEPNRQDMSKQLGSHIICIKIKYRTDQPPAAKCKKARHGEGVEDGLRCFTRPSRPRLQTGERSYAQSGRQRSVPPYQ